MSADRSWAPRRALLHSGKMGMERLEARGGWGFGALPALELLLSLLVRVSSPCLSGVLWMGASSRTCFFRQRPQRGPPWLPQHGPQLLRRCATGEHSRHRRTLPVGYRPPHGQQRGSLLCTSQHPGRRGGLLMYPTPAWLLVSPDPTLFWTPHLGMCSMRGSSTLRTSLIPGLKHPPRASLTMEKGQDDLGGLSSLLAPSQFSDH